MNELIYFCSNAQTLQFTPSCDWKDCECRTDDHCTGSPSLTVSYLVFVQIQPITIFSSDSFYGIITNIVSNRLSFHFQCKNNKCTCNEEYCECETDEDCASHLKVHIFLVADTQLYKRLCPSVSPSVRWSIRQHESKSGKMSVFENFLRMFECEWGIGVWMGVGRPCPPIRNDIVTPRRLFNEISVIRMHLII